MSTNLVDEVDKPKKVLRRKIEELGEELGYLEKNAGIRIPVLIIVEG